MLEKQELASIVARFGLTFEEVTEFYDTSHGEDDIRWNFILDRKYVLKINSERTIWEQRLQEISRLIGRYRSIGVYAPQLIPTAEGPLSFKWEIKGVPHVCFVEEYAAYPVYPDWKLQNRKEVVEHLGMLAAKYTGVDLSDIRSMWSIIDLAPLDDDIDEKQENTNTLVKALEDNGFSEHARRVDRFNEELRAEILRDFDALPRCVYQGDLNSTNELHKDGHFVGLIDFNMSGTDVNINVFVNETNWFPDTNEFDAMSVPEILSKMDAEQAEELAVIFKHYTMNDLEKRLFPYYQRITNLFQYPNVCLMVEWLKDDTRWEKCAALIETLIEKPLV